MDRRHWLLTAASVAAAGCGSVFVAEAPNPRVVQIHTRKFDFLPDEVRLARGEPVILELIATDIAMGFRCKELNLRTDVTPGKPVRLSLTPQTAGKFHFYCDVFCGDGHEDMDGHIIVSG